MAIFVTSVAQTGGNFQNQRYFVFRRLQYDISIKYVCSTSKRGQS